jgi:hypothetical protein
MSPLSCHRPLFVFLLVPMETRNVIVFGIWWWSLEDGRAECRMNNYKFGHNLAKSIRSPAVFWIGFYFNLYDYFTASLQLLF